MNAPGRLQVEPDTLLSSSRVFHRSLHNFEDLHRRVRSLWESLPDEIRSENDLDRGWMELQKHGASVVRGLENFSSNLRKKSDQYETLDLDLSRSLQNMEVQIQSLLTLLSGRSSAKYKLMTDPNGAAQRHTRLGGVSAAGGSPLRSASVPKYEPTEYTVQSGESLQQVATKHHVSVDDMLRLNPGIYDPESVSGGQKVIVPAFEETALAHAAQPSMGGSGAQVDLLAQSNSVSCGQTSVAMSINTLTGKHLTDVDVNNKYGFGLMDALRTESAEAGYTWKDGGDLSPDRWSLIQEKVNSGSPVIVGLNGDPFSHSGRGHIVTITRMEGEKVYYNDPNGGEARVTTRTAMENCPPHPDGKFVYYPDRLA